MANRKGVFIGAYVPASLKRDLSAVARGEFRTLSAEVERRLTISLYGPEQVAGRKVEEVEELICASRFRRHQFKERGKGQYAKKCLRCGSARVKMTAV